MSTSLPAPLCEGAMVVNEGAVSRKIQAPFAPSIKLRVTHEIKV